MNGLREFNTIERVQIPYHHIDPGFINKRLVLSTFGSHFVSVFNQYRKEGNDHWTELSNNHLMVDIALTFCKELKVKLLSEVLSDLHEGSLFCSTEEIEGSDNVYEDGRKSSKILLPYQYDIDTVLVFGTEHFVASTGRSEVTDGAKLSIIGRIREISNNQVIIWPLIIGAPSFDHQFNKDFIIKPKYLMWYGWVWYEIYPEDKSEFSAMKNMPDPSADEWLNVMKEISEESV